jgi:hypothetical protein
MRHSKPNAATFGLRLPVCLQFNGHRRHRDTVDHRDNVDDKKKSVYNDVYATQTTEKKKKKTTKKRCLALRLANQWAFLPV